MLSSSVKRQAKRVIAPILFHSGKASRRHSRQGQFRILTFHRVSEPTAIGFFDPSVVNGSPEMFRRMLLFIRKQFNVVSLKGVEEACYGKGLLPEQAIALTFDDGYRDVYSHAFPILQELGLPAAFFITTGLIDQESELLWTDALTYVFSHTANKQVDVPGLGLMRLNTQAQLRAARIKSIMHLKGFSDPQ